MVLLDLIISAVVAAGVVALVVMVIRKFPKLRLLDVVAMPKAKLRSKKYQLIASRLERKKQSAQSWAKKFLSPVGGKIAATLLQTQQKLAALEHKYRSTGVAAPENREEKEKRRQKIAALMEEGQKKFTTGDYAEAERMFLEVVRLNPKEVEAFECLGEIYLSKKEYDHAVETLEFAKKLKPQDDRIYCDLGLIYAERGDDKRALTYFQKCVNIAPHSPRNLDYLVNLAIKLKKKYLAEKTLQQLRQANPENNKILELEKEIKEL